MPSANFMQTSFAGGEWSEAAQGQTERKDYRAALNVSLNALVTETGAHVRRPGFLQLGYMRGGARGSLTKFDFKESTPHNMEFTDGFLRFWRGKTLVYTNDAQEVASVSTANPAVIGTALAHGWSTGDEVYFTDLGIVAPLLQGRTFLITVTGASAFSIRDAITGANIDGSLLAWTAGGAVRRVLTYATPYTGDLWSGVRSVQAERQAVLLSNLQPQILTLTEDPGEVTQANFTLEPSSFKDGPYLDPFPGSIATPSGLKGNISLTFSFQTYDASFSYSKGDYVSDAGVNYKSLQQANLGNTPASSASFWQPCTGADQISPAGFTAGDIGRHIRLYSRPPAWAIATAYAAKDVVLFNDVIWEALASSTGSQPGQDLTKWTIRAGTQYAIWSWGRITAISGAGQISGATGTNIGNMTSGGGLAAAFDGTTAKAAGGSAARALSQTGFVVTNTSYVGKHYGGGSEIIGQVIVYPSTDLGFAQCVPGTVTSVTLNLRVKNTAPATSSDGVVLATSGAIANTTSPVTLVSSDQVNAYAYAWIEMIVVAAGVSPLVSVTLTNYAAQVVFFNPNAATGSVVTLQLAGPPLLYTSAVSTWRAGLYSDAAGWPRCGTYHEGRLWLSGAKDNRVDSSYSNDIFNFEPTKPDGTVTDANAISYVFNSPDVNAIFWMKPDQQGIVCGTQAGEWVIEKPTQGPIAPTNIAARRHTEVKCANVEPVHAEITTIFVQKNKRRLMEYFADVYSGKFTAPNLSKDASHLSTAGFEELAYQQDLVPTVWSRDGNGALRGMTYRRDSNLSSQGPTIAAWHRHTHGGERTFQSIVVGPSQDGNLESLAVVTTDGTYYYVELLHDMLQETDALTAVRQVDAGITPSAYSISADRTQITLYGLWGLNGKTVAVWAGGLDVGDVSVTNGQVTVSFGDGIESLFTADYVDTFSGACPIILGFTYTSRGQLVRPVLPAETGARTGVATGKVRREHKVVAHLTNTLGIYFGTTFNRLRPAKFRTPGGRKYNALQVFSGIFKDTLDDDASLDGMICWEVRRPYPAIVAQLGAMMATQDE